ncbi:helicase associated domain-containing protein [Clostridium tertium]|uniref:helicase associated domain-containing protein n=1 Tax=Clostridium tertium TaxID=1559 RepID=UPI0024B38836|nr:helicase associated domain-containing protein [Clostridium tertium]MDI9218472.1 helicase associated domain-containing protein [Clostridium tertium]
MKFLDILYELSNLSIKQDFEGIKYILQNSLSDEFNITQHKGFILEYFIAELINSTTKHALVNEAIQDDAVDVLVYSQNYSLEYIIQAKNHNIPISKECICNEIIKFKSSKYRDKDFIIISLSGFNVDDLTISSYEKENIYLKDFDYLKTLICSYTRKKLSSVGSSYYLEDEYFNHHFDMLVRFDCKNNISSYKKLPDKTLTWCTEIRKKFKDGTLNIKQKLILDKINFYWDGTDIKWYNSYYKVKDTYDRYGSTFSYVLPQHNQWIYRQIYRYIDGTLSQDKYNKLCSINLINEWLLNVNLLK